VALGLCVGWAQRLFCVVWAQAALLVFGAYAKQHHTEENSSCEHPIMNHTIVLVAIIIIIIFIIIFIMTI